MERIEEIRNFICDVYTGRITSGYSDKALTYCKDLLATLAERDKELTAATKIVENQEAQIMRLAQEKEQAEWRATYWEDMAKSEMKEREQAEARVRKLTRYLEDGRDAYSVEKTNGLNEKIINLESRLSIAREGLEGIILKTKGWRVSSYDEAGKFTGSVACDGCKISNDIAEQTLERMK